MKIIVHRGIDQIGGCITEIATNQARIIIDLGLNLPKGSEPSEDVLNSHEAINDLCNGVDAIFYTHYHSDHVGLFKHVPKGTKQYIGEISKDIIRVGLEARKSLRWLKKECKASLDILSRFKCYQANKPIVIGDIRITTYVVSRSEEHTSDLKSH